MEGPYPFLEPAVTGIHIVDWRCGASGLGLPGAGKTWNVTQARRANAVTAKLELEQLQSKQEAGILRAQAPTIASTYVHTILIQNKEVCEDIISGGPIPQTSAIKPKNTNIKPTMPTEFKILPMCIPLLER